MPIELSDLAAKLKPSRTVLFFGAGSSMPSGGPSGAQLTAALAAQFNKSSGDLKLTELVSLLEETSSRKDIVTFIRSKFERLEPARGLLALPNHGWHRIYTTNWDLLIEKSYEKAGKPLTVIKSNFDLPNLRDSNACSLVKIHGTITEDRSFGNRSSLLMSEEDYREFRNYREAVFRVFEADIVTSDVVIVGHSLADEHIKAILEEAQKIAEKMERQFTTYIVAFEKDPDRAALLERRGFKVAFGQVDDLFLALGETTQDDGRLLENASLLGTYPTLQPVTTDVEHAKAGFAASLRPMFNGKPASYADVAAGYTFARDLAKPMFNDVTADNRLASIVVGSSGVGKTTLCRQVMSQLAAKGVRCWEHDVEHVLDADAWIRYLQDKSDDTMDVLFVDNAHEHVLRLNKIMTVLEDKHNFRFLLAAHPGRWGMQIRNPKLMRRGVERTLSQLSEREIDDLIRLVEANGEIRALIEDVFGGYPAAEKKRRLKGRCGKDMFVCMKNIFNSKTMDMIILEEFDDLPPEEQQIYRLVAAIEASGVRAHRQMIIRLTGLAPSGLRGVLARLAGVVSEFDINPSQGVYGWSGRHPEICRIVKNYKFSDEREYIALLENIIDSIVFTYEVEAQLFDELCLNEHAIPSISTVDNQNRLYERMIAMAPTLKLPRHRIIRNLITQGAWDRADDEIRQYEADLRRDAFSIRSRIYLALRQVQSSSDLSDDFKRVELNEALEKAFDGVSRFDDNKYMFACLAKVASAQFLMSRDEAKLERAMALIEDARERLADPFMEAVLSRFRRFKEQHDWDQINDLEDG